MCVSNPEPTKATVNAVAPGNTSISILFSIACFIKSSPGSDIPGIPASLIKAIFSPSNNLFIK